jgi:hypothetical protein
MKYSRTALFALLFLAALTPAIGFAQNVITGTWSIQPANTAGRLELELRTNTETGHHSHDTSQFTVHDLGLQPADLEGASHPVHFTLRRDAGSIDFTGTAADDVAAGHFTFTSNPEYGDALAKRGLDRPTGEEQLAAVTLDISLSYIDGITSAGIRPTSYGKVIAFRALGIIPQSIRELRRQFGSLDEEGLITFSALHITPGYIQELASAGYTNLSAHELTELKALNVDGAYIRRVQAHGYKHPTVRQLVELKAMNIL